MHSKIQWSLFQMVPILSLRMTPIQNEITNYSKMYEKFNKTWIAQWLYYVRICAHYHVQAEISFDINELPLRLFVQ